jgi:stage IV sporulation protein FB
VARVKYRLLAHRGGPSSREMLRFRLFGIPFEVGPYFWILSACLGSSVAHGDRGLTLLAIWMACVFVSIVVHELGHALMARRFGLAPQVALHWLGGTTYMPGGVLTRPQGILVTLAGPAAGLALWALVNYLGAGVLAQTAGVSYAAFYAVSFLVFINLYWTLFNLLPILPLDGGQFVRNLLGPGRLFFARMLGGSVAVIAAVACLVYGELYMALFLGMLAVSNFRNPVNRRAVI